MFTKLLKYEWKASAGLLSILSLCALGVGLIGSILMRFATGSISDENIGAILTIMLAALFVYLALIAYVIGSEIFLMYRFYKSKFTDEGYLTFTLPVRSWQIFLAAFLNNLIWMLIIGTVLIVSMFLVLSGILSGLGVRFAEVFGEFEAVAGANTFDFFTKQILFVVVSFVSGVCLIMSSITIGSVLAKKHKILASIGIYYGISMVLSIVTTIISVAVMFGEYMTASTVDPLDSMYVVQTLIQGTLAVGGFFLSVYLMDKKLNLP